MASDLSKLIKDSFTITLNGLLAKDAKILKITKAHAYDLEDTELLQVETNFDFSNFSSKFLYLIPAKSASLIFNTMMGSPITDLADEIDEDAEDAINEFVSNTCGGLTTTINAAEFEDVGQTKFNIAHREILNGNEIKDLETTFRFEIDLEDHELILYITFAQEMIPHIAEFVGSEVTVHKERKIKEEEPEDTEIISHTKEENSIPTVEDTEENIPINKDSDSKNSKIKKLIMILGGLLSLIIISFLMLYFIGVFDSEEPNKIPVDTNTTKQSEIKVNKTEVIKYTTVKKVDFKMSDIDKNRLNSKLEELTKYKVLTPVELKNQELAEKKRLVELEKEKKLLEFSKRNQEEPIIIEKQKTSDANIKTNNDAVQTVITTPEKVIVKTPEPTPLKRKAFYAVTNSLKYSLFKKVVQETKTTQARISICNDNSGKTTIYIGPFESENLQSKMIQLTQENNNEINIKAENITEEEFNLRCNLE